MKHFTSEQLLTMQHMLVLGGDESARHSAAARVAQIAMDSGWQVRAATVKAGAPKLGVPVEDSADDFAGMQMMLGRLAGEIAVRRLLLDTYRVTRHSAVPEDVRPSRVRCVLEQIEDPLIGSNIQHALREGGAAGVHLVVTSPDMLASRADRDSDLILEAAAAKLILSESGQSELRIP